MKFKLVLNNSLFKLCGYNYIYYITKLINILLQNINYTYNLKYKLNAKII